MTEYVTGQIYGWNGGKPPVHPKTKVEVWTRNGGTRLRAAWDCSWVHCGVNGDIVCFQVITPYDEPKTIWVNEYPAGNSIFKSEEEAKEKAMYLATRIAVEYVEKQK